MSTATKLQKILDTKSSIKKALQDKGLTVDDVFSNYPDKVNSMIYKIQISSSNVSDIIIQYPNNVDVLSCKELFNNSKITEAPLFDTSNITDMVGMFYGCNNLTTISKLDMSSVTDFGSMFNYCSKLSTINILNLGKQNSVTSLNASITIWGQGSDEALQSLKDSLITNSFDRKTAGYSTMTIYLSTATKALLTDAEKAQITAKGYTIA